MLTLHLGLRSKLVKYTPRGRKCRNIGSRIASFPTEGYAVGGFAMTSEELIVVPLIASMT